MKRRPRKSLPGGVPDPVDVHVGGRVRARRIVLGLSQEKLGDAVGLTFQQIQKYERGANRIGASRLFQFSQILGVAIDYFFDGMPGGTAPAANTATRDPRRAEKPFPVADPMERRETLELVRAYYRIKNPRARRRLYELVKAAAKGDA